MKCLLVLLAALFAQTLAWAQSDRTPVQLSHTGDDSVGQRLAFEIREVIRGSQGMRLVTASEADPRMNVSIVSVEGSSSSRGISTAAAMTIALDSDKFPLRGFYLTTVVQICGNNRVQECARDLASDIDRQIEYLKREWPTLAGQLRQAGQRN